MKMELLLAMYMLLRVTGIDVRVNSYKSISAQTIELLILTKYTIIFPEL